jgi:hypothetical protein
MASIALLDTKKCRICNCHEHKNCVAKIKDFLDPLIYPCQCGHVHKKCLKEERCRNAQSSYKCARCKENYLLARKRSRWTRKVRIAAYFALDILAILLIVYLIIALCSYIAYVIRFNETLNLPEDMNPRVSYYLSGSILLFGIIGLFILFCAFIASFDDTNNNHRNGGTNIFIFGDAETTAIVIIFFAFVTFIGFIAFGLSMYASIGTAFRERRRQLQMSLLMSDYTILSREDLENLDDVPYAEVHNEYVSEIMSF